MYSGTIPHSVAISDEQVRAPAAAPRVVTSANLSQTSSERLYGIDVARVLAAIAIVFHHSPRSSGFIKDVSMIGRFSTPLFSLLAAFFLVRHFRLRRACDGSGLAPYVGGRIRKLVVPFVAWSIIYLAVRELNRMVFGKESTLAWLVQMLRDEAKAPSWSAFLNAMQEHSGWSVLWAGTSYQLWFLPFLFVVSMAAVPVVLLTLGNRTREVIVAAVLVGAGLFMTLTFNKEFLPASLRFQETNTFAGLLYFRSASFLWGLAFGLLCVSGRPPALGRRGVMVVTGVASFCLLVYVLDFRQERLGSTDGSVLPSATIVLVRLAAACILFLAFANWKSPLVQRIGRLGKYGFGIYLSHVLVVEFLHSLRRSRDIEAAWWSDLLVFAIAFPASFMIAWGLSRSRSTKWLIP